MPCGDPVDVTSRLTGGRIEIVPPEGLKEKGGVTLFELTRLTAFFEGVSVERACGDVRGTASFAEIGVSLAGHVPLRALKRKGVYFFTIPKTEFRFYESIHDNGPTPQPQTAYQRPTEDVTGELDLERGTIRLHVVIAVRLHIRAACPGLLCIDVEKDGTQTVDLFGRNAFPDGDGDEVPDMIDNCPLVSNRDQVPVATPILVPPPPLTLNSCLDRRIGVARATDICEARPVKITNDAPRRFASGPNLVTWNGAIKNDGSAMASQMVTVDDMTMPTVACKATRPAGRFRVTAGDDCSTPVIHLGDYIVANGEVIEIQLSDTPGVVLLGTDGGIRVFRVGRADAMVTAIDVAGNAAGAVCR
jgi:hypothetical protein